MASRWDAEWRHHDLSTPLLTAASVYAIEAMASLAHHEGEIDAAAAALALGVGASVWARSQHFWLQVYLTVVTVVSLAWILYAEAVSPFTARALTAFGVGALFLGALYPVFAFVDRRDKRRTDERLAAFQRRAQRGEWPATFAMLGVRDVELVSHGEFRAGLTFEFRLPAGRDTFSRVAGFGEKVETVHDLPRGSVRFRPGETARVFHMDIHTRDVLAEDLPFEFDPTPTTINEPFDIGLDVFGEDIEVLIREIRAAIFAPPGSGKSNLLNVLIARLLRCVDVVIWVIDFKHRLVKPWLQPWFEGRTDRPALDWVATTPREALLMCECLKKGIDHRSVTGVGSKITPSSRQPSVILISDETASAVGLDAGPEARALAALIKDIIGRGRSEAIDAILTFLRPTVEMTGTSTFKALSKLRITLPGLTAADAASATDSPGLAAQLAEVEHPGAILVNKGRSFARLGKGLKMEDADVPVVAAAYSRWRPELEPDLEEVLGEVYAQRWSLERSGHLLPVELQRERGYEPKSAAGPTSTQDALIHRANAASLPTIPPPPANAKPAYRTVDGTPIPRKLDPATVDEMFAGLRAELGDLSSGVHEGKERMLGIVRAAGPSGISPGELLGQLAAAGVAIGRQALHGWLNEAISNGTVRRLEGERGVYVAVEHA